MERPPKFVAVLRARVARRPRQARVVGQRRERRPLRSRRGGRSSIRSSARVEIGGIDPRVGIWNPPLHELAGGVRVAGAGVPARRRARAARPHRARRSHDRSPGGLTRVEVARRERRLPRRPTACRRRRSSTSTSRSTRPRRAHGCELVDPGAAHQMLGHLDGWGHGLHTGANLPRYPGTRGTTNAAWASYLVRGTRRARASGSAARAPASCRRASRCNLVLEPRALYTLLAHAEATAISAPGLRPAGARRLAREALRPRRQVRPVLVVPGGRHPWLNDRGQRIP